MLNTFAMLGMQDGIIVLVAILILFGGKKIPELMRGVGQGVGELRKGMEEGQRQVRDAIHTDEPAPTIQAATPTSVASAAPAPSTATVSAPTANPNTTPVP